MFISVVIPTYNPNLGRLKQTLDGLRSQTLVLEEWELIIIDNNSSTSFSDKIDISWHPSARIITEKQQGLTAARIKGFNVSKGDFIVMVDDDNLLHPSYLNLALEILITNSNLGAIGGKSTPIFEDIQPTYLKEFYYCLALRDLGDKEQIAEWDFKYPACAPIGAGMAIRKTALRSYIKKIEAGINIISDRQGTSLSSGGDNDIIIEILKSGFSVGYFPQLSLQHIIPKTRTSVAYLSKLNFESSCSWVKLLSSHNILPWKHVHPNTLFIRYIKAYITNKAWRNNVNYIRWKGACGIFKGLSDLNSK